MENEDVQRFEVHVKVTADKGVHGPKDIIAKTLDRTRDIAHIQLAKPERKWRDGSTRDYFEKMPLRSPFSSYRKKAIRKQLAKILEERRKWRDEIKKRREKTLQGNRPSMAGHGALA